MKVKNKVKGILGVRRKLLNIHHMPLFSLK